MRNGSLWSDVIFEKEVIFHEFDLETSDLEFEVTKSSIWKHTTSCDQGVFSNIIISQLWRPIELKFSQVCYFMHMLRYTKWEDWSLTITNTAHVFKPTAYPKFWFWNIERLHNTTYSEQRNALTEPDILDQRSPTSVVFNGFSWLAQTTL